MKTDNELIAEFMGFEKSREVWDQDEYAYTIKFPDAYNKWMIASNMRFSTSWDWLMPVVEKIGRMEGDVDDLVPLFDDSNPNQNVFRLGIMTPIDHVYKSVIEFIKWYNENKAS